ncbi:MAG: NYN domain-containing protein [Ilumatobacteraceae bacterium]
MTKHVIVDGSNIATEGRSSPSLAQLSDAVTAFMKEYPNAKVTVVVDATFGHRIARKEVAEFNKAIEHNELVAPPAGAIGRGDAFILAIADKARATVLSNDSYQEFHGKYRWLFDEGRLIGGKPVPHVGWVFVERVPARGPTSRKSVRTGKVVHKEHTPSPEASKPMPVPKAPPPGARVNPAPAGRVRMANEVMPYLAFVEKNPVGTSVNAVITEYNANGLTVSIGEINGYMPLRNVSAPPPRSARESFKLGDKVTLVVVGYTASRRSVDLAVPGVVKVEPPAKAAPARKAAGSRTPAKKAAAGKAAAGKAPAVKKAPAKKAAAAKKAAPARKAPAAKKAPAKKAAAAKKAAPARRA